MNRILATALFALVLPAMAGAQNLGPDETEVRLDSGNIELAVNDGTTISVAPGSHLTFIPAKGAGEPTRINVLKGVFRISNVFNKHSDIILIRTGEHTFELNRGSALIEHTDTGPQGTLLHGTSLSIQGRDKKLTRPGMRLRQKSGGGGFLEERSDSGAINKAMNKVSGKKVAAKVDGVIEGLERRQPQGRLPDAKRLRSQILQRADLKSVIEGKQGFASPELAPPPPPYHPPPPPHPPHGKPPPKVPPNMPPPKKP